jgi:homoserine O-acetyltransferase
MNDGFSSSDSIRTARPLAHAQRFDLPAPLELEGGGVLPRVSLTYETWGRLSEAADNAVLVCHALSGDSHAARHDEDDDPGWWDVLIGPGRAVDTDRYFVVCANVLGGCRGSTGPDSLHPETGERYGADFPPITVGDMVETQRQLLDHLGIDRLVAVVGGSLGGHQALAWGADHPERTRAVIALATSARLTAQAIAFDVVGRNAILRDPRFAGGRYADTDQKPEVGLALARMLGHITYLSRESMDARFDPVDTSPREVVSAFERKFSVGSYLAYQGERFVERFDANSYMTLSLAMDRFDLGGTPKQIGARIAPADIRWLIVSFSSDWLFPPIQSRHIVDALVPLGRNVTYCEIETDCGHDAFLLEDDLDAYGRLVQAFLDPDDADPESPRQTYRPTQMVGVGHAVDDAILGLLEPTDSILDLGCGGGALLGRARARGHARLMGVEIDCNAVVECAAHDLPVIQADLDEGLVSFADDQFDVVVLSETLQLVKRVEHLLEEMLRVGKRAIVSFSNAACAENHRRLFEQGSAPRPLAFEVHDVFEAPPMRLFSLSDFDGLCDRMGLHVERRLGVVRDSGGLIEDELEREADLAIYVLSRRRRRK